MKNIDTFIAYIVERESIRIKRERGDVPPWTADPILQKYRFTNVNRENDTVTRWVASHWREPYQDDPNLPFAMCVAIVFNRVTTLEAIGYPVPWNQKHVNRVTRMMKEKGEPVFGNAYLLSTHGQVIEKLKFAIEQLLNPAWRKRATLKYERGETLESMLVKIMKLKGFATFKAAQVIRYLQYAKPYHDAPDWHYFVASGPGSKRGLNLILGREMNASWVEEEWKKELLKLQSVLNPALEKFGIEALHAGDTQNCACEFSKYMKAKLGLGRPKELFKSGSVTQQKSLF